MKLLLDEMFPATIATALRDAGYDVIAACERADLREIDDSSMFIAAQELGRALVTENVDDFARYDQATHATGVAHYGLICTNNRSLPRHNPRFIGEMIRRLTVVLKQHPDQKPTSLVRWL